MWSTVKHSCCLVTRWLTRGVQHGKRSLPYSTTHSLVFLSFFLSFFFFYIFKTNASEGAETRFSLPFKATERHKARPAKNSSLNHTVKEMGVAAPLHSSAAAWWTALVILKIHPWAAAEVCSPAVILLNLQWLPTPFHTTLLFVPFLLKVSSSTCFRLFIQKCLQSSSQRRSSSDRTMVQESHAFVIPPADACQPTKLSAPASPLKSGQFRGGAWQLFNSMYRHLYFKCMSQSEDDYHTNWKGMGNIQEAEHNYPNWKLPGRSHSCGIL